MKIMTLDDPKLDKVHSIEDYHDGPRSGFADFEGEPHHFDREFNELEDEFSDDFVLIPIDARTLSLAIERWSIWQRWRGAFDSGKARLETHPSLPEEKSRYGELSSEIDIVIARGRKK
jgi:hypothetical protein